MTGSEHALLQRAVDLAHRGPARDPNPRVGCVVTDATGKVVGEGFHAGVGTPHAEAVALEAAGEAAAGGTVYVTLEPCKHAGRTGPCTTALLRAEVARVVYAVPDPTPRAAGGAGVLAEAGTRAEHRPMPTAETLVADWAWAVRHHRPRVTWKVASTIDGKVAATDGSSRWITSAPSRRDAHALRAAMHAVVVGTGTVHTDDPALTARDEQGRPLPDQPLRVVVGHRDLPPGAALAGDGLAETVQLRSHDPHAVLEELHRRCVRSVLLEGGPTLAGAFWRAGLVDELVVYLAPALLGAGVSAIPDLGISTIADIARLTITETSQLGPDLRLTLRPTPTSKD